MPDGDMFRAVLDTITVDSVFRELRKTWGIRDEELAESFSCDEPSGRKSSGKSKSLFFPTVDRRFFVKTISRAEWEFAWSMMDNYCAYMRTVKDSYINRVIGLHYMSETSTYFVVIENALWGGHWKHTFDIKGSLVGRTGTRSILKDREFIRKKWIKLSSTERTKLIDVLSSDVEFLCKHCAMDYSLLIGVSTENSYKFCIIDFFQRYTKAKEAEHDIKALIYQPSIVSCTDPQEYASRLIAFISKRV